MSSENAEIVIQFDHVTKRYSKYDGLQVFKNVLDRVKNGQLRGKLLRVPDHIALNDVSFTIRKGEKVGLIGHNGAGKSTSLRLLAGVSKPTAGKVFTNGKIGSVLDLGVGFHPDLTARDNIYLQGTTYGFSKRELDAMTDEILRISELHNFIDVPLKKFSSGMKVRLGFSIAMITSPDIVLLDEVLAVGDQAFKSKSLNLMKQFLRDKTLVLVTHSLSEIQHVCERVIILNGGKMVFDGPVEEGLVTYRKFGGEDGETRQVIQPKVKRGFAQAPALSIKSLVLDESNPARLLADLSVETGQPALKFDIDVSIYRISPVGLKDLLFQETKASPGVGTSRRVSFELQTEDLLPGTYELQVSPYVQGDLERAREVVSKRFGVPDRSHAAKGIVDLHLRLLDA